MTRLALLRVASLPFEAIAPLRDGTCAEADAVVALEAELARDAQVLADRLFALAGSPTEDPARTQARFALLRVRRDVHNGRVPKERDLDDAHVLLAADDRERLRGHVARLRRHLTLIEGLTATHRDRLVAGRRALLHLAADPLVSHGIYLASRSLAPKARRLASADPSAWSHDERHAAAKIAAYVSRFAAKTSPNGVFCSVALASVGGPAVSIEGAATIERVDVLLSLSEVRKVAAVLAIDPAIERAARPRPNPTLRLRDGVWTFWNPASPRNPTDVETYASLKDQPVLAMFLETCASGTLRPDEIVDAVRARTGLSPDDLRRFYTTLVERGVVIGEVEVPYSRRRRLRDLAAIARRAGCDAAWIAEVERIEDAVDEVPAMAVARRSEAMDRIVEAFERLKRGREFRADELFRVDAASGLSVRLPADVVSELSLGVRALVRLISGMFPEEASQRRFVARFLAEHPPDTDVEFLDLYRGFVEKLDAEASKPSEFPMPTTDAPSEPDEAAAWACAHRTWEWFVARARAAAPGSVVALDEATVRELSGEIPEPRWTAGVLFQVAARDAEAITAGNYALVLNAVFNGIGLALSRFAHLLGAGRQGDDNPVIAELRRAWASMERPGAVLAEITFNHEARTANAGLRPILFANEIELPGDLVSPGVARIPLTDLVARFDSASGRIVLRSIARGVEVVPVLSSGVSPSGIVSELIHLGRQGWQSVGYLPGFHAPDVAYWPRFVFGRVVLFRARWSFRREGMPRVARGEQPIPDADWFLELRRWRARHALPRHVFVHTSTAPKPFYVDLDAPILADLLRRAIATSAGDDEVLHVTEMLPGAEDLWLRDGSGSYASEFLIQLEGPEARPSS